MTLEDFVTKYLEPLGRVQKHGGYYKTRCPAHEDKEPSLSVSEKDNGWINLHCFAGCSKEDILSALKLENIALLVGAHNFADPVSVHPYRDEHGEELYQSVRFPPKRMRYRRLGDDGEWIYKHALEDVRRVLYNLPEVIEAVEKGEPVYLVEGEKDADRGNLYLQEHEKPGVFSTPGAAGSWRAEYNETLRGAKVVIWADRDGPGRRHAGRIQTSLQGIAEGIWTIQSKRGNDFSDHVDTHKLKLEDYEPMSTRSRRGLVTSSEMADAALERLELREHDIPGYVLSPEVPVVFRQGRMYAIGAYTGHGKTSYALPGLRNLCEQQVRCGYFTNEMPEQDLMNKLIAHTGLPLEYTEETWKISQQPEMLAHYNQAVEQIRGWDMDITFDTIINADKVMEVTSDREYDVVFVDHIHRFAWGTDRQKMSEQVTKLTNMALELNVCVVLLCQLRKFQRGNGMVAYPRPTLQDFRETSSIGDDSSMALAIWRQTDDHGTSFTGQTLGIVLKNRHTTGPHDAAGKSWLLDFDHKREMFVPSTNGQHQEAQLAPT